MTLPGRGGLIPAEAEALPLQRGPIPATAVPDQPADRDNVASTLKIKLPLEPQPRTVRQSLGTKRRTGAS